MLQEIWSGSQATIISIPQYASPHFSSPSRYPTQGEKKSYAAAMQGN